MSANPSPSKVVPSPDVSPRPPDREKPIDEFELVHANRSEIVIDVVVTNRGCPPERGSDLKWDRFSDRVGVRIYYRDQEGGSACALYQEVHRLEMDGPWEQGTYTIFAQTEGSDAPELTVAVP